ncbi:DUF1851 domain-containing protein [Jeotgalibacillus sp. ET6]|uniref:T6SS immunity protein Tdi1 domain-containing protein n=1 Tax=Jeotgalibacillus sp. ET6 TaxID=3037260 RepID=UPI00241893E4|nr:T6SS immunity protein Tdi1 domain-containing protein [Jeotgalibacillus sp. ET6]MDG5471427.1 DUF1851 domain-containing protein [Jeotgalibacillus sp. ET6]
MKDLFNDWVKHESVDETVILNYQDKIPEELLESWKIYGFGAFGSNFLRTINPDDYIDILEKSYRRHEQAIPIFTTAMGDILVWEKHKYINLLNFRKGVVTVVSSGFEYFFDDLQDIDFMKDELMCQPYHEAIRKYDAPNYDECFGYTPLLGLGGAEKVENLKKVKLKEHILIITDLMGPVS